MPILATRASARSGGENRGLASTSTGRGSRAAADLAEVVLPDPVHVDLCIAEQIRERRLDSVDLIREDCRFCESSASGVVAVDTGDQPGHRAQALAILIRGTDAGRDSEAGHTDRPVARLGEELRTGTAMFGADYGWLPVMAPC